MLQFFLGSVGGLAGQVDIVTSVASASLVVDRPMAAEVAVTLAITGTLSNVPQLGGTIAMTMAIPDAELITPLPDTGADDLRRRVISSDVWEFRGRKIEQLH
jgi:hypothetical protein